MSTKSYKGPKTPPRYDGSDVFRNLTPETIASTQTYPAFKRRNEVILMGEWLDCYYYQKIAAGRRCSCWGNNDSPSGECKVCYGTGIVGGWEKLGTAQWILDPTTPNIQLLNVVPLSTAQEGPVVFGLGDNVLRGEIYASGSFEGCWGSVDMFESLHWLGEGSVSYFIKTPASLGWKQLTQATLQTLFATPQVFDIKVVLERASILSETPLFSKLHLRILRNSDSTTIVRANKPRSQHSLALSELGVLDEWTSERWWMDATLTNITSEDWFYDLGRNMRWKVVDLDKFAPQAYLLSWDLSMRKLQTFEAMFTFPI